ncbi:hypothetical protein [Marixanthomonas spongiae]|uniref:Uncharacterized protein n=1 Tax=Marixanthomonas spongiae TaxID=2174845 RepID=A0A2U0I0Z8_9FLAO|nr:hypothetical protein [Marixanthomonas spongiae]PVW14670.1 hypothetical protein DDV96_09110 [Marixanthomonas spongiae]
MKKVNALLCTIAVLLCYSSGLWAQEMKAKKHENPEWVRIAYVKFKPMMKDKAKSIINDYFMKAGQNSGGAAPTSYDLASGEYDMLVIFPMEKGIETLNYKMTEEDVKWMGELSKLTGGQEKAMAKMQEFYSYVAKMDSDIAMKE